MGKTKNKSHSEVEHLRGENKKLRSEVRQLQKLVKSLQKMEHMYEDNKDVPDEPVLLATKIMCDSCGKGHMEEMYLLDRLYGTCNVCDHRKRLK